MVKMVKIVFYFFIYFEVSVFTDNPTSLCLFLLFLEISSQLPEMSHQSLILPECCWDVDENCTVAGCATCDGKGGHPAAPTAPGMPTAPHKLKSSRPPVYPTDPVLHPSTAPKPKSTAARRALPAMSVFREAATADPVKDLLDLVKDSSINPTHFKKVMDDEDIIDVYTLSLYNREELMALGFKGGEARRLLAKAESFLAAATTAAAAPTDTEYAHFAYLLSTDAEGAAIDFLECRSPRFVTNFLQSHDEFAQNTNRSGAKCLQRVRHFLHMRANPGAPGAFHNSNGAPGAYSHGNGAPGAYSQGPGAPGAYSHGNGAPGAYTQGPGAPCAYSHGPGAHGAYSQGPGAYFHGKVAPGASSHGNGGTHTRGKGPRRKGKGDTDFYHNDNGAPGAYFHGNGAPGAPGAYSNGNSDHPTRGKVVHHTRGKGNPGTHPFYQGGRN